MNEQERVFEFTNAYDASAAVGGWISQAFWDRVEQERAGAREGATFVQHYTTGEPAQARGMVVPGEVLAVREEPI